MSEDKIRHFLLLFIEDVIHVLKLLKKKMVYLLFYYCHMEMLTDKLLDCSVKRCIIYR